MVVMDGVSSFRNYIFDIDKIRKYLRMVAPLPFNKDAFSYSLSIQNFLSKNLNNYSQYKIIINGEQLFKSYSDKVKVTKKGYDVIDGIQFFNINISGETVAHGWYGLRKIGEGINA